jgi:hypothetical protein
VPVNPERPSDSPNGNWIQRTEGKCWFPILRLYGPLQIVLRQELAPSEIEVVPWTGERGSGGEAAR